MSGKLESALAHARAGWPVFPLHYAIGSKCSCRHDDCKSPGKHPRTKNGAYDATTDAAKIEKWWSKQPKANIGGRLDGLVCIDVDIGPRRRGGKTVEVHGDRQLDELESEHGRLPRSLVQFTGSGSQHILFRQRAKSYPKKLARDIDIKYGKGAYIVLHGSNHVSGEDYRWKCGLDAMPVRLDVLPTAPNWFETAWESEKRSDDKDDSTDLTSLAHNTQHFDGDFDALEECVMAVRNDKRFESRDEWLNFLAAIHFETDGSEDGRDLAHRWSDTWKHGDDPDETDHVWESFGKRSNRKLKTGRTIAQFAREDDWEPPSETGERETEEVDDPNKITDDDDAPTKATKRLNRRHALVMNNGRAVILNEEKDGGLTWSRDRDFLLRYGKKEITVPGKPTAKGKATKIKKSVAQIWLKHPKRRDYVGVTMAPNGKAGEKYNLWRGFSVEEDKLGLGSFERVLTHIRKRICRDNEEHFTWFVGWLAHMIQRPEVKPGVAVALKGPRGAGKSIIGQIIHKLLAAHTIKVSSAKHLVGQFNSHLSHAIFVRVEEAFWVGDRAGANVLKDLITGETVRIEPKGVDSFEIPSYHRFLLTSNDDWVVPAGMDERRFAVFEVSGDRAQDRAYFGAMLRDLDNGGYGALLSYLLAYDLDGIDVGQAPMTEALVQQKIASAHNVEKWWIETVDEGVLPVAGFDEYADWSEEGATILKSAIYDRYERWLQSRRFEGDPVGLPQFTKKLRDWCWRIKPIQRRSGSTFEKCLRIPRLDVVRADRDAKLKNRRD